MCPHPSFDKVNSNNVHVCVYHIQIHSNIPIHTCARTQKCSLTGTVNSNNVCVYHIQIYSNNHFHTRMCAHTDMLCDRFTGISDSVLRRGKSWVSHFHWYIYIPYVRVCVGVCVFVCVFVRACVCVCL